MSKYKMAVLNCFQNKFVINLWTGVNSFKKEKNGDRPKLSTKIPVFLLSQLVQQK